jgi:hypothetical protein
MAFVPLTFPRDGFKIEVEEIPEVGQKEGASRAKRERPTGAVPDRA